MKAVPEGEFKIVFTGPMGAGKTTAIAALSDVAPVRTEVENTDRMTHGKEFTTVGLDMGRITLASGEVVHLYGTPGQARFRFMWDILGRGAAGVIILLDATQAGVLVQFDQFVDAFAPLVAQGAVVVGVGRTGERGALSSDAFAERLEARGFAFPVLSVDVRLRDDVLLLIETLGCVLEARAVEGIDP